MPVCVGAFAIPGTWQQNEHILISLRAISMAEEIKAKELLIDGFAILVEFKVHSKLFNIKII